MDKKSEQHGKTPMNPHISNRKKTKKILVGNIGIGGNAPISIQTMTNTDTEDVESTIRQIKKAELAGADIVRVSVPTVESIKALRDIIKGVSVPLVADIHFNYKRAIEAMDTGVHCVRINPGNMEKHHVKDVVKCAKDHECAIRIGINSGSIERDILEKFKEPSSEAIVESALRNIHYIEDLGFFNFKVSVKSSDVLTSVASYRKLSEKTSYPLHLGITEAGPLFRGLIKSSIGIGSLLMDGIGDTLRVSLSSSDIEDEVRAGRQILNSIGLLENTINIISCPTCSRTNIDVVGISNELEEIVSNMRKKITISILGCVVNGVGEAVHADIGVFGFSKGVSKIYFRGKEYKICSESDIISVVKKLLEEF